VTGTLINRHTLRRGVTTPRHRESQQEQKEYRMTNASPELDVRQEAPATRHGLIFTTYAELAPGQSFVLVNGHDPLPLY
jgi:hypothetical protein